MSTLPAPDRPGIFGQGTINDLPRIVADRGLERILLLTGKRSFTASGAARLLPKLEAIAQVQTWSDFSPNPEVDDLLKGVAVVEAFGPDAIVAIGGGSVLDMAKLLAAFGTADASGIPTAVRENAVPERSLPLILIPTTSGSGAEATHFAVAYIGEEKFSVTHQSLLPDFVVLDPVLTESASKYQKATSVIDAIAQAIESRWSRGGDPTSQSFAEASLADLVPAAPEFLAGDSEAAVAAARGSYLAGRAIDISKTTGAHALAYALTRRHGISHGHAVATTLGAFARIHAAAAAEDPQLHQTLTTIATRVGAADIDGLGDRIDGIAADLGLELRLGALGVPREDIAYMASAVNTERLGNNPVPVTQDEIEELLNACW